MQSLGSLGAAFNLEATGNGGDALMTMTAGRNGALSVTAAADAALTVNSLGGLAKGSVKSDGSTGSELKVCAAHG